MKKLALAAMFISSLASSTTVFAQNQGPVTPPKLAGPIKKGPGQQPPIAGQPGPGEPGFQAVSTVTGKVVKLSANDDFTFDGFYMISGSDSVLVRFPAHMGTQISPLAKTGSQITVSGVYENSGLGRKEMKMVSINMGDKTLTDTPPSMSATPAQQIIVTGNGKVTSLQTDPEGRVNGVFIDNKTVLRFPPHVSGQLGDTIAKGTVISYSGNQKNKEQGEISLEDYKVIRCNTITVNGQQFLVR